MYYFIVNPHARSGAGARIWQELHRELENQKASFRFYFTKYVGHARTLAAEISRLGTPARPVTLVAVGGDGTVCEVLSGITDLENVLFGFIPVGSGNDFCRGLQLPTNPMDALHSILKGGRTASIDVPVLNCGGRTCRFGISTGIGYDAAVCQEVLSSPYKTPLNKLGLGKLVYLFIALKQLLFTKPTPMTLQMDGNRHYHYDRVYFAAVMNLKYEGGGFMFCPAARPSDGVLDVILVEGLSRRKVLLCLPTAFFGKHTRFKGVHIFRCRHIEINSVVPLAVHKDGESGGIQQDISVCLEKKTLKMILPVI